MSLHRFMLSPDSPWLCNKREYCILVEQMRCQESDVLLHVDLHVARDSVRPCPIPAEPILLCENSELAADGLIPM